MKDWDIIYETPEMLIGKHRWRMQVYAHPSYGGCTRFQWYDARPGRGFWRDGTTWPTYNHNDGCYGGMPKTLTKLYEQHERDIMEAVFAGSEEWLARNDRTKDAWNWDYRKRELDEARERWGRKQAELLPV